MKLYSNLPIDECHRKIKLFDGDQGRFFWTFMRAGKIKKNRFRFNIFQCMKWSKRPVQFIAHGKVYEENGKTVIDIKLERGLGIIPTVAFFLIYFICFLSVGYIPMEICIIFPLIVTGIFASVYWICSSFLSIANEYESKFRRDIINLTEAKEASDI